MGGGPPEGWWRGSWPGISRVSRDPRVPAPSTPPPCFAWPPSPSSMGRISLPHHPGSPGGDIIPRPPALVHLRLLDEAEGAAVPGIFGGRAAIAEAAALGEAAEKAARLVPAGIDEHRLALLGPPAGLDVECGELGAAMSPPKDEGDVADIVGARAAGEQEQSLRPPDRRGLGLVGTADLVDRAAMLLAQSPQRGGRQRQRPRRGQRPGDDDRQRPWRKVQRSGSGPHQGGGRSDPALLLV